MNVGSICSRHVVTVDAAASLQKAAALMREHHVGALVVTATSEQGACVAGMITDRDLAIEVLARGADAARQTAGSLARGPLASVSEGDSLADAVDRMQSASVRRLLVHDDTGHLVGLVSLDDLLPVCLAPLAGLAETMRRGREREVAERGAISTPTRPALRVPAMGTAGWKMP